jgi:hypothetical protein
VEPKRFSGKSAYGAIRDLADGNFAAPNQLAASHPSRQLLGLLISIREHRIDRKRGLSDGAMIFVVSGLGEFIATKNLGDARRVWADQSILLLHFIFAYRSIIVSYMRQKRENVHV